MAKGTIALGQYRGKVGGQVLRVVDGKQVMQAYQPSVRNPRTHAQQLQRAGMRKLGKMSRGLLTIVRTGFGGVYPASMFIKANISRNAGALNPLSEEDVVVQYGLLNITNGSANGLVMVNTGSPDYGDTTHLHCEVTCDVILASSVEKDRVRIYFALYNPDLNMCVLGNPTALPLQGAQVTVSVDVPSTWDGTEVHGWVFASVAENGIDPDAFDQTSVRLPKNCTPANYVGQGEIA